MNYDQKLIQSLKNGEIAVIPTDTLYGIVAAATNRQTVEQVYRLRRRNPSKPCIILISDLDQLESLGITSTPDQAIITQKYWPGPVSLIFQTSRSDLKYLHRGTGTLAIRLPDSDNLRDLIRQTGPLIAPSPNHEGRPPATTVDEARAYFGDSVTSYINGGLVVGKPSGLIDLTGPKPQILRPL